MRFTIFLMALAMSAVVGCGKPAPDFSMKAPPATNPSAAPAAPAKKIVVAPPTVPAPVAPPQTNPVVPSNTDAPPATTTDAAPAGVEQVVAQKGVGIKGRSLDAHEGIVVTPAKSLFAAKERIVFDIQLPSALQLFRATDPTGAGPTSHEQFMSEVIEANQIPLPKLPEGHKYLFDPKTQLLMVQRPKAAAAVEPPK